MMMVVGQKNMSSIMIYPLVRNFIYGNYKYNNNLDELSEVHIFSKQEFLIQGDALKCTTFDWSPYGLKISVPKGAVAPAQVAKISVAVFVGGKFDFPENTQLVSAVYGIKCSKSLLKPVEICMQHCVNIKTPDQVKYLSFAKASHDHPPYKFEMQEGGKFSPHSRYGSICLSSLSFWVTLKNFFGINIESTTISDDQTIDSSDIEDESETFYDALDYEFTNIEDDDYVSDTIITDTENTHTTNDAITTTTPFNEYVCMAVYETRPEMHWLLSFILSKDLNALIQVSTISVHIIHWLMNL